MAALVGVGCLWILYTSIVFLSLTPPDTTVHISTAKVKIEDRDKFVKLTGSVTAFSSVSIKARLDSQITKINVNDGDFVKEGDLLFELDDRLIKAQISQAEANLSRDKSEVERSERQFKRDSELVKRGNASKERFDKSKQANQAAVAAVAYSEATLKTLKTQLAYTQIHAPISGRLGFINTSKGNTVKAYDSTNLVSINRVDPIYVRINIPQQHFGDVTEAMKRDDLKVIATGKKGEILGSGKVSYKENKLDEQTRTLAVDAEFQNPDEKLWPNMFVNVDIVPGHYKDAKTIPLVAVRKSEKGDYVFVIREGKAKRLPIQTIDIQEDIAIVEGNLLADECVAINNFMNLSDDSTVTMSNEHSDIPPQEKGSSPEASKPSPSKDGLV